MTEYTYRIGKPEEDALFLIEGFSTSRGAGDECFRVCSKEFRFKVFRPQAGRLKVGLGLQFQDTSQGLSAYLGDVCVGEIRGMGEGYRVHDFTFVVPEAHGSSDHVVLRCELDKDPHYPPRKTVRVGEVRMESLDGDLVIDEGLTPGRISQFPLKLVTFYRSSHEIRKIRGTQPRPYKYSGETTVYFGDIHVHTNYSKCGYPDNGSIEENVLWAKERSLDFIAVTDHAEHMEVDLFARYFQEIRELSAKHDMVIIPALEWTSYAYGHRNIYFLQDRLPFFDSMTQETDHPKKLAGFFQGKGIDAWGAIHHSAYISHPADFGSIDSDFEPVIEVYSTWGNSERFGAAQQETTTTIPGAFVQDALNRGLKLGFVGGGDVHNTKPGDGGLTAVLAEELSVDALWRAMQNRLCYATSNDKIGLDFHINGFPMGSVLRVNEYSVDKLFPLSIAASVVGTAPLSKMELIQNGEAVYTKTLRENKTDMDLSVVVPKLSTPDRIENPWNMHLVNISRYYYIRVTQCDGSMAWSSPIWIDFLPREDV